MKATQSVAKICIVKDCTEPRFTSYRTSKAGRKQYSFTKCYKHWGEHIWGRWKHLPNRYLSKSGYIMVRPSGATRVRPEHTIIMEKKLGRRLRKGESVHHKNGVKTDNNPENLELWVGAIRSGQRATDIVCPHCRKPYGQS